MKCCEPTRTKQCVDTNRSLPPNFQVLNDIVSWCKHSSSSPPPPRFKVPRYHNEHRISCSVGCPRHGYEAMPFSTEGYSIPVLYEPNMFYCNCNQDGNQPSLGRHSSTLYFLNNAPLPNLSEALVLSSVSKPTTAYSSAPSWYVRRTQTDANLKCDRVWHPITVHENQHRLLKSQNQTACENVADSSTPTVSI